VREEEMPEGAGDVQKLENREHHRGVVVVDGGVPRHLSEQFFDATTDAIFFLDRQYRFTYLNRRAQELLAPAGEVLGKNLFESFPGTVYKDSPYQEIYRRSMEEGLPGEFDAWYPEPLNMWLRVQSYPANDGIFIYFRDVTDEVNSREELRKRQEETERQRNEIETMYRTAPIGLALFDTKDFRYLRLNDRQAEFFGLKPEQIVGRTLTEMAPIEGLRELFEQVLQGRPVVDHLLEGELATRPGEHRYWKVSYFPVFAADGSVEAISAASLEITQQRKAEEALIQSEKLAAVGRLASSISHEINNPLESVTNLLYLIEHDTELPSAVSEYVHLAQAELARVSQIATQTLRFHRQSVKPTWTEASHLVESVLDMYRGRIANIGIEVNARYTSREPVRCFENDMRQVLSNLISNAMDAMRADGGRMVIRAHDVGARGRQGPGVRITIADTGLGMSKETASRIYDAFFTTKELHGTGLGLWISAEIVDRHGGRLRFRSRQGHGTVFTLVLPRDIG
jgi:PAS domain S-box-containing protein